MDGRITITAEWGVRVIIDPGLRAIIIEPPGGQESDHGDLEAAARAILGGLQAEEPVRAAPVGRAGGAPAERGVLDPGADAPGGHGAGARARGGAPGEAAQRGEALPGGAVAAEPGSAALDGAGLDRALGSIVSVLSWVDDCNLIDPEDRIATGAARRAVLQIRAAAHEAAAPSDDRAPDAEEIGGTLVDLGSAARAAGGIVDDDDRRTVCDGLEAARRILVRFAAVQPAIRTTLGEAQRALIVAARSLPGDHPLNREPASVQLAVRLGKWQTGAWL